MTGIKTHDNDHLKMKPKVMLKEVRSDGIAVVHSHCIRKTATCMIMFRVVF
jgi:hypothetical protein